MKRWILRALFMGLVMSTAAGCIVHERGPHYGWYHHRR
jgi:hypothetical protein